MNPKYEYANKKNNAKPEKRKIPVSFKTLEDAGFVAALYTKGIHPRRYPNERDRATIEVGWSTQRADANTMQFNA